MNTFARFLEQLKVPPAIPANEAALSSFEQNTGLRVIPALRELYLTSDGIVLKDYQLEILPLSRVSQLILGDDSCAPFSEYGIPTELGCFPLTESFDSNPIAICCRDLLRGYVVHVFHDDSHKLLFRNMQRFLDVVAENVARDGWDWELLPARL